MPIDKKELILRVISGIIVGPAVVFSFLTYPTLLGLVTTIIILAAYEFFEFSLKEVDEKYRAFLTIIVSTSSLLYGFSLRTEYARLLPFEAEYVFGAALMFTALITMIVIHEVKLMKEIMASTVFALVYISFFLSTFYNLQLNYGASIAVLALTAVWSYDAFAYFFGLTFGKHRIALKISPKKSYEGALGGFVGTFIYIYIYDFVRSLVFNERFFNLFHILVFSLIVTFFDTLGDFTESVFKRAYEVKDSGEVLPGHGGMLDRIDGLLFVVPAWYFTLKVMGF